MSFIMSYLFDPLKIRQGLSRTTKTGQQQNKNGNSPLSTPPATAFSNSQPNLLAPEQSSAAPRSPALSATMSDDQPETLPPQSSSSNPSQPSKPPFFFREEYSGLIVKGSFLPLSAQPLYVEEGEWLAHQIVEQYRLLTEMVRIIQETNTKATPSAQPLCNPTTCPTMSASVHTYTWLDNHKNPIPIPAQQYIQLVQKWILGKVNDQNLFPTDVGGAYPAQGQVNPGTPLSASGTTTPIGMGPTSLNQPMERLTGSANKNWLGKVSGFPEGFESDIKSIYRQMMRVYSHIYHGHWLDFYHLSLYQQLNTCFVHFINVGRLYGLLGDKDIEPMRELVVMWEGRGMVGRKDGAPGAGVGHSKADSKGSEGMGKGAEVPAAA